MLPLPALPTSCVLHPFGPRKQKLVPLLIIGIACSIPLRLLSSLIKVRELVLRIPKNTRLHLLSPPVPKLPPTPLENNLHNLCTVVELILNAQSLLGVYLVNRPQCPKLKELCTKLNGTLRYNELIPSPRRKVAALTSVIGLANDRARQLHILTVEGVHILIVRNLAGLGLLILFLPNPPPPPLCLPRLPLPVLRPRPRRPLHANPVSIPKALAWGINCPRSLAHKQATSTPRELRPQSRELPT